MYYRSMENIIEFAYTGSIHWNKVCNWIDLIKDADFLGVEDLKEEALLVLPFHLNPLNALDAYDLSISWSESLIKRESQEIILKHFNIVSKTPEFLKLNFDSVKDILSSNPFINGSEKIFEGVLRWILTDLKERRPYLLDIFRLIQIGYADSSMVINTTDKCLARSVNHE